MRNGSATPDWLLNQSLAEKALLRLYQNPSPWTWLVPEGVVNAVSVAPPDKAALPFELTTVISRTWLSSGLLGE